MKPNEKAHLDNYVERRDAEIKRLSKYADGGFERSCNEIHANFLDKVEEKGYLQRYINALTSDSKDIVINREARELHQREEPRLFDVVLGGKSPKPDDAVKGK